MKTLLILLLLCTPCFAKDIQVNTGYGYLVKDGNIIVKEKLPAGKHQVKDEYDYVEVFDQTALDAVQVYTPPATVQQQTNDIQFQLDKLDSKSIRCLRSMVMDISKGLDVDPTDKQNLNDYETQAKALRQQLKALQP